MAATTNHSRASSKVDETQVLVMQDMNFGTEREQDPKPDLDAEKSLVENSNLSPRKVHGPSWALLCIAVFSAQFLFSLDNTIVADVQPSIVEDLGEIQKLPWITVAFELGAASANLFWGKIYGLFNNKILFLSSILLFEIGSAICGAAPTMNALIVGRVICGLGGNGIYIGVMNIISAFTTLQERPLYVSYAGIAWCVGIVLGPIVGGAFADSRATWRWSFYINICVGGAMLPIYLFLLPSHNPSSGKSILTRMRQIDAIGVILFVGAFTSGIIAISFGGVVYAWNSGQTIGSFICSGVLWILFGMQQTFLMSRETRLFPVHLLRLRDMWILFAQTSSSISMLFIEIYFVPLYFQFVQADNALMAGVRLLPMIFVGLFFSIISGGVMGKFGLYMPWYLGGSILAVVGAALMRIVGVSTPTGAVYGYSVILAAGIGSFVQASFPVAQAKVAKEDVPASVALIGCAQLSGLALSFSIAYSIFLNTATKQISAILPTASIPTIQSAIAGVGSTTFQALPQGQKTEVLEAVANSISYIYDQVLAGAILSLILALFMKRERLFLQG